jgi:hypothetical protein
MRGECCITKTVKTPRGVEYEVCGKPSVYSEPCDCDRCDTEPGYHLPWHYCAEHYDKTVRKP